MHSQNRAMAHAMYGWQYDRWLHDINRCLPGQDRNHAADYPAEKEVRMRPRCQCKTVGPIRPLHTLREGGQDMALARTPMRRSTTPMKRSPIERSAVQLKRTPMARSTTPMKTRWARPSKIRQSARGEDCTLRFPGCRNDRDTVVWCHSNRLADGKGMGIKAADEAGCYGCATCHAYLDWGWASDPNMTFESVQQQFERARLESGARLQHKGLIA